MSWSSSSVPSRRLAAFAAIVLLLPPQARAQQAPQQPAAATISSTGLLPIYGVDLALEGAPADEALKKAWPSLAPLGVAAIRFDVDVRDPGSADVVARACVWAAAAGVKLVPVLIGAKPGEPTGVELAAAAGGFVTALWQSVRGTDAAGAGVYQQILAFQIGRAMNDSKRHGGMTREAALLRVLQTARAIRKAEAPLADAGLQATPIMIEASFDAELTAAGLDPNVEFSDAAYASALAPLTAFVTEAASSADLDLIAVEYLPGTAAPGDASHLGRLAGDLAAPAQGRKIVIVTGMAPDAAFPDDQRKYYALAFANLADHRAGQGPDSALAGLLFRWALEDPAREALQAVAASVSEAEADTPPSEMPPPEAAAGETSPPGGSTLVAATKDKVQQFLLGLVDRSLEKLASGLLGGGGAASGGAPDPSAPPGDPVTAPSAPPQIVFGDISTAPTGAVAGSTLQVDALVYNKSSDVMATGLTAALVDESGGILNADTMPGDLEIGPSENRTIHLTWTPGMPGKLKVAVVVADASFAELAKSPYFTIAVAPPELATTIAPASPGPRAPLGFPVVTQLAPGAASQITVTLKNPYRTPITALAVTIAAGMKPVTRSLPFLAPGQTRSLTFAGAALARGGGADVTVMMTTGGKSATVSSRVLLPAVAPAMAPAPARAPVRSPLVSRAPGRMPAPVPAPGRMPAPVPAPSAPPRHPVMREPPPPPARAPQPVPPPMRAPQRQPQPVRIARPDVAIVDAGYAVQQTRSGQLVTITVTVRNVGDGVAQGVGISCGAGGARSFPRPLGGAIGPGHVRAMTCQATLPASARSAQVGIAVSAPGDINPSNNQRSLLVQAGRRR